MTDAPSSFAAILQAFTALLIVLGLIAGIAWLLRKYASGTMQLQNLRLGMTKTTKRLGIVESLWLDARYRVVIIRDGDAEHRLLLGPQGATELGKTGER